MQLNQAKNEIEKLKLQLQEKSIDMKYATDDKKIDAQYMGQVSPQLQQASDNLSVQNVQEQLPQQQAPQQPIDPKRSLLKRMIDKVRGR